MTLTDKKPHLAVQFLSAAIAGWMAISGYTFLLGSYSGSRFWEGWVVLGGTFVTWAPIIILGALAGFVVGILIGFVFKSSALLVAGVSGVAQGIFMFFQTPSFEVLPSLVAITVGLLLGAMAVFWLMYRREA